MDYFVSFELLRLETTSSISSTERVPPSLKRIITVAAAAVGEIFGGLGSSGHSGHVLIRRKFEMCTFVEESMGTFVYHAGNTCAAL